ncbi:hypothetical protein BDQ12DRAFT_669277 [Crucibulum laeve]|uniref:Uncharacterized protein n=1 Tax=Crucibulum laeve TaxID=68775 RepID=A0A5C3M0J3_9AGAR|nr:hypothetical protein BDQ12DRAFT_669277 [Crucibulum laeve]
MMKLLVQELVISYVDSDVSGMILSCYELKAGCLSERSWYTLAVKQKKLLRNDMFLNVGQYIDRWLVQYNYRLFKNSSLGPAKAIKDRDVQGDPATSAVFDFIYGRSAKVLDTPAFYSSFINEDINSLLDPDPIKIAINGQTH